MPSWYKDWRFWLLFLVINISGNLAVDILFDGRLILAGTFLATTAYLVYSHAYRRSALLFFLLNLVVLLVPGWFEGRMYSYASTAHVFMRICTGVNTVLILRQRFVPYYIRIIVFFAVVSLICFALNCMGVVIPYLAVESTTLDGGRVMRVSSLLYTQLYGAWYRGGGLNLRNCGPFWEPGAFQGFLNLALLMLVITTRHRGRGFYSSALLLVITVVSTYSTGGYVVLFLNLALLLFTDRHLDRAAIITCAVPGAALMLWLFMTTDFLYAKIAGDTGRLGFSLAHLARDPLHALFGYGYAAESIQRSDIRSASSMINLIRYSGLLGFAIYVAHLFGSRLTPMRILWAVIIFLILMNEPFITAGPFWWGVPFVAVYLAELKVVTGGGLARLFDVGWCALLPKHLC